MHIIKKGKKKKGKRKKKKKKKKKNIKERNQRITIRSSVGNGKP